VTQDHQPTRRAVLRQALAAAVALSATAGCSGEEKPPAAPPKDNPFGVAPERPLDVVVAEGRAGDVKFALDLYKRRFDKSTVAVTAVPQLGPTLLPRFGAGKPPDAVQNTGRQRLSIGGLVGQDQLTDLRILLDAPAWGQQNRTVRDVLTPGILESGSYDGTVRALNYVNTVYAFWYSAPMFERQGWEIPRTWPELIRTAIAMKAKGLPPFTYAGSHPYYIFEPLLTLAAKTGGHDVTKNIDNLEDGAWSQEGLTSALQAFGELAGRGLLLKGTANLDHTTSQTRFLTTKAAFLPCGNWLENEMRTVLPKNFGLTAFAVPPLEPAGVLPNGVHISPGQPLVVPAKAQNRAGGLEFVRAMLSKEAATAFATATGSLTVVRGALDGEKASTALRSAGRLLDVAGDQAITWYFDGWYPELGKAAGEATGAFMAGAIKAPEWSDRLQRAADAIKKDKSVTKYHRD